MNLVDDLVALTLRELGGVASTRQLLRACSRRAIDAAVVAGTVVRLRQGSYGLPDVGVDDEPAIRLGGVISHASAAQWHGWSLKRDPEVPVVTVPRHRTVPARLRRGVEVRYADLQAVEVQGHVTSPLRTVVDCARTLPFDEALAIADSALRDGPLTRDEVSSAVAASSRTGRARAQWVAEHADGRAANAFESVVRAISLDVPGLALESQVRIGPSITPDLVDRDLRVVVECDSWTYHAEKSAFARDLERYNEVALDGWLIIRVNRDHAWERPGYVRRLLERAADVRS